MYHYIIRYTNNYSDLIITDADHETFRKIHDQVEEQMADFFFDAQGDTKTDFVARELRLQNYEADEFHNIPEFNE